MAKQGIQTRIPTTTSWKSISMRQYHSPKGSVFGFMRIAFHRSQHFSFGGSNTYLTRPGVPQKALIPLMSSICVGTWHCTVVRAISNNSSLSRPSVMRPRTTRPRSRKTTEKQAYYTEIIASLTGRSLLFIKYPQGRDHSVNPINCTPNLVSRE